MTTVTVAEIVINRFGGTKKLSEALGHSNPTTVDHWRKKGRIPLKHWPDIERAALSLGYFDLSARWLGEFHAAQEVRLSQKKSQSLEVAR